MDVQIYNYATPRYLYKPAVRKPVPEVSGTVASMKKIPADISFEGNPFGFVKDINRFLRAKTYANAIAEHVKSDDIKHKYVFRQFCMEPLEGIQYGIKAFKDMTMKEIQYMSENLHVIAVKRGCKNMCGYCYADAKPQKREMSWEDFTTITHGFKKLRKRLGNINIYGENFPHNDVVSNSTELFYDSDCIDLIIKNKKGKEFDFIDMAEEIYNSLGRKTVFDTSGWNPKFKRFQKRAEKYADYFSKGNNMAELSAFNLSFNLFNAAYIASVRAARAGDVQKAERLRGFFTDRMANALYTFTPVLDNPKFFILSRCFNSNVSKNSKDFDERAFRKITEEVLNKLSAKYTKDLNGGQKYVKTPEDISRKVFIAMSKMTCIDTGLNSAGRMKNFMKEFNIKTPLQDHTETTKILINEIKKDGRFGRHLMNRLIDTDGKVYQMDYARFFPTELQLNIPNKDVPSPHLANTADNFTVTKEILNRPENPIYEEV